MRRTRRRKHRGSEPSDPRQKALDLIELALDPGATDEERRTAAVRAVKFIDDYDLLSRPFEGNKTVQATIDVLDKLADPSIRDGIRTIGSAIGEQIRQARRR